MKIIYTLFGICLLFLLITGCGDVSVNIDENNYNPKIVIDGYISPGQQVSGIILTRNYGLDMEIDLNDYLLTDADVTLTEIASGNSVELQMLFQPLGYADVDGTFTIESNKAYKLDVSAEIDGKSLTASSITTVPAIGFSVDDTQSQLGNFPYHAKDTNGDIINPLIIFDQSPSTDSYITSIVAQDASLDNFIEENAFGLPKNQLEEEEQLVLELAHQWGWNQTQLGNGLKGQIEVSWFAMWFYGNYQCIVYAADKNFTDYVLTHRDVQEIDGNLLEPKFHIEGDGIGVFGSFIADTVYFQVTP